MARNRPGLHRGRDATGNFRGSWANETDYLQYVADLLSELEELAKRYGNQELAERLRHSRQAAERR